jgi:hypothetical protein
MSLGRSLYIWAKSCAGRQDQLQEWLDTAIMKAASGQGKTVASTTANGVSVSFMTNSLTIDEWIAALIEAIGLIENPITNRKAIQIFR